MQIKTIGKLVIPAIGQGTGESFWGNSLSRAQKSNLLRQGIDLGLSLIDTAEGYGQGGAEEIVSNAIRGIRDQVFLSTKVSPENLSFDSVLRSAELSLKRLGTEVIDLYQIHWPNPKIPISETMLALEKLQEEGKIRHIGVSNFSLKEFHKASAALRKSKISSMQVEYNLSDRSIETQLLPFCDSNKIVTIAYSPLDQGRIGSGDKRLETLNQIAQNYGKTTAQISLSWLVSHSTVVVVPKATNPVHIRENADAADIKLAQEDIDEINRLFIQEIIYTPTHRIRVVQDGQSDRQTYQTIEEALANKLAFTPSPADLAQDVLNGNILKPVRVIATRDTSGKYDYDLIEGRIRYWAWVIAFKNEKPIPTFVRG